MTQRIKLTIAYLGSPYHGWQRQPGQRTVQGEIEHSLVHLTKRPRITVTGAGRTDAGVHARAQVAHADLPLGFPPAALASALNARLPQTICIMAAVTAPAGFHARFSARGKAYTYRITWGPVRLPWQAQRAAPMPEPLDRAAIERCAKAIIGRHDMASFTVSDPAQGSTVRTIFDVRVSWGRTALRLDFFGSGFLRYQVRRMAGAILEVGAGKRSTAEFVRLITDPEPGAPLPTAPARGLTLEKVYYRLPAAWAALSGRRAPILAPDG